MATPEGARALIDSKYLVKNLGLKDPSRMVKSEVEAYYKHWISRQDDGKKALVFRVQEAKEKRNDDRTTRIAALNSKKRSYVEVDSSDDAGADSGDMGQQKSQSKSLVRKKVKAQGGKSKAGKDTAPATGKEGATHPRPTPRPFLSASARKGILLTLSMHPQFQSLVDQVMKAATVCVSCQNSWLDLKTYSGNHGTSKRRTNPNLGVMGGGQSCCPSRILRRL
jgi:hypothetical protein